MSRIDETIDRLDKALRTAGFEGLAPPTDLLALDEIAAAIEPMALPADLRRFWERVDPARLRVQSFPELNRPASALELYWVHAQPEIVGQCGPPLLFPVASDGRAFLSIELASRWSDGGTVFDWFIEDAGPFRITYRSFTDLLEVRTELIEEGVFSERGRFHLIDVVVVEREWSAARLEKAGPHPLYGEARELVNDLTLWPAHWLECAGIDLRDREPRGRTHTIAELRRAAVGGEPIRARIAGRVIRLAGVGDADLAVVDDGTAQIDVRCPVGTSPWGPSSNRVFEFEVTVAGPLPQPPDLDTGYGEITRAALSGRLEDAQAAVAAFFGRLERQKPSVVAIDIRPID